MKSRIFMIVALALVATLCHALFGQDGVTTALLIFTIALIIDRLKKIYIFRVALAFGMIEIKGWDKRFFFEKLKNK